MRRAAIIGAVVAVLAIIVIVLFIRERRRSRKPRPGSLKFDPFGESLQDVFRLQERPLAILKKLVRGLFKNIGETEIPGRGTMNNLRTGDLLRGSGNQEFGARLTSVRFDYTFAVEYLKGFFGETTIDALSVKVLPDSSLLVIPRLVIPQPAATLAISGRAIDTTTGLPVASANCSSDLTFTNLSIVPQLKLTVEGCGANSRITQISLEDLAIDFEDVSYDCSVRLLGVVSVRRITERDISGPLRKMFGGLRPLVTAVVNRKANIPFPCLLPDPKPIAP